MRQTHLIAMVLVYLVLSLFVPGNLKASEDYDPQINPTDFSFQINNKYFTLNPGTTFVYKTQIGKDTETNEVAVTNLTRDVMGVKTLVVWDRVWFNDTLVEETYDWFAQHKNGDVWYFGEQTKEYQAGKVSSKGSWEAGVDSAKPGIIMKANPQKGDTYFQEYYPGEAEDQADVVSLGETVKTPFGTFDKCLKTLDYTQLEPRIKEYKYYCQQVGGVVLTVNIGSNKKDELIDVKNGNVSDNPKSAEKSTTNLLPWVVGVGITPLLIIGINKFARNKSKQSNITDSGKV